MAKHHDETTTKTMINTMGKTMGNQWEINAGQTMRARYEMADNLGW